jgi:hypothetical protein
MRIKPGFLAPLAAHLLIAISSRPFWHCSCKLGTGTELEHNNNCVHVILLCPQVVL